MHQMNITPDEVLAVEVLLSQLPVMHFEQFSEHLGLVWWVSLCSEGICGHSVLGSVGKCTLNLFLSQNGSGKILFSECPFNVVHPPYLQMPHATDDAGRDDTCCTGYMLC